MTFQHHPDASPDYEPTSTLNLKPTNAAPGSPAKIATLRQRLIDQQPLWNDGDNPIPIATSRSSQGGHHKPPPKKS